MSRSVPVAFAWLYLWTVAAAPAQADPRQLSLMPDPRGEFIRLCAPFMVSRYAHPEAICNCVRNALISEISDPEILDAMLYGVTERGVPTLSQNWLPREKWPLIGRTMTAIAEPTLDCMFGNGPAKRAVEPIPLDGMPNLPPVQDLTP
ncbi:MAG: hypothetical protein ABWY18_14920 [Tardiphaga sp.]